MNTQQQNPKDLLFTVFKVCRNIINGAKGIFISETTVKPNWRSQIREIPLKSKGVGRQYETEEIPQSDIQHVRVKGFQSTSSINYQNF